MDTKELMAQSHHGRDVMYNCFSRFFLFPPDEKMYSMIETILPQMEEIANDENDESMQQAVADIKKFLKDKAEAENKDEFELDVNRFYTRVMCLGDSVPNTESYYTSPEKLYMQEARDEVLALYAKYKMPKAKDHKEHEDFISVELAFMSFMASETADLLDKNENADEYIQVQLDFHAKHFDRWVEQFVMGFNRFPESAQLYGPLARMMLGFIRSDKAFLEEIQAPLDLHRDA